MDDFVANGPLNNYGQPVGTMPLNNGDGSFSNFEAIAAKNNDLLTQLTQQKDNGADALDMLWTLAQSDPAYMELYLQLKAARDNYDLEWNRMDDYYVKQYKAMEKAGLNPWLALQNMSNFGTALPGSIGSFGSSGSTSASKSSISSAKNQTTEDTAWVRVAGTALAAVIGLIIAML